MTNLSGSVVFLSPGDRLPDPSQARDDGLVAVGGDLSVERLLEAYHTKSLYISVKFLVWWFGI